MQGKARPLHLKKQQMRPDGRILHQVVHARFADLDVRATQIKLHVVAGIIARKGLPILEEIKANRVLGIFHAHHRVHRTGVIA